MDEDVLLAAKQIALARGESMGKVLSTLVRQALKPAVTSKGVRNGVPLFPRRDEVVVTLDLVNQLRDEGAA